MSTEPTTPTPATQKVVLLAKEHDIAPFASNDASRYVINGLHYDAKGGFIEATNGRMLIRVPVETSDEFPPISGEHATPPDAIIPTTPFRKALANLPKNTTLPIIEYVALSAVNGEKLRFTTNDLEDEQNIVSKRIDGNYPRTDEVIPQKPATFSISLSAGLLQIIATYFNRHGQSKTGDTAITFQFTADCEPVRFAGVLASGKRATGVLMPMRLS